MVGLKDDKRIGASCLEGDLRPLAADVDAPACDDSGAGEAFGPHKAPDKLVCLVWGSRVISICRTGGGLASLSASRLGPDFIGERGMGEGIRLFAWEGRPRLMAIGSSLRGSLADEAEGPGCRCISAGRMEIEGATWGTCDGRA